MSKIKTKLVATTFITLALAAGAILPRYGALFEASAAEIPLDDPYAALEELDLVQGDAREEYRLQNALDVSYGKVFRFQQIYQGRDVLGGQIIISADRNGNVLSTNGKYRHVKGLGRDTFSVEDACATAQKAFQGEILSMDRIVYPKEDGSFDSAYKLLSTAEGGMEIVISASKGNILSCAPVSSLYQVSTKQKDLFDNEIDLDIEFKDGNYSLADETRNIYAYDAQSSEFFSTPYSNKSGSFDAMAVSAFHNAVTAYDYYTDPNHIGIALYGMNGGNDQVAGNCEYRKEEIPLKLMVHFGKDYENASYEYNEVLNESIIRIGDGSSLGQIYLQGAALDVVAHEYQHGVTHFAANLEYLGESGALDEAFSDIFGSLVEGDPSSEEFWTIGENAAPAGKSSLRSIKEPAWPQRANMQQKYNCTRPGDHYYHDCDCNGVHYNSTIISHVQYKIYDAMPEYFTRDRIGQLWYSTLCTLTSRATFAEFSIQFLKTAYLLGLSREACHVIRDSLIDSGLITEESIHLLTFVDYDGEVLQEIAVEHNGTFALPPAPVREETDQFSYEFIGWDFVPEVAETDLTITALYREILRSYTVRFLDADGLVAKEESVLYGSVATPPELTKNYQSGHYSYEFIGWDKNIEPITGDIDYIPVYQESPLSYIVTYFSKNAVYDRTVLVYQEEIPLPELSSFFQTFEGWYLDKALTKPVENTKVEENTYLYASWKPNTGRIALVCAGGGAVVLIATGLCATLLIRAKRKKSKNNAEENK